MVKFLLDVIVDPKQTARGFSAVNRGLTQAKRGTDAFAASASAAFQALSLGFTIRELGETADAYQNIQNRLRTVIPDTEQLAAAQSRLLSIANETRTSFRTNAEVFQRFARVTEGLGVDQDRLFKIITMVNKAVAISGATSIEASQALRQLSQGLGSGALRGDELRSVMEQLPVISDILTDRLGITTGQLKDFGERGKITSRVIIEAFEQASNDIDQSFGNLVPTLGQRIEVLKNQFLDFIGTTAQSTGVIQAAGNAIAALGENISTATNFVGGFASVYATTFLGRLLLGGPFKVATTALGLLSGALIEANSRANEAAEGLAKVQQEAAKLSPAANEITELQSRLGELRRQAQNKDIIIPDLSKREQEISRITQRIRDLQRSLKGSLVGVSKPDPRIQETINLFQEQVELQEKIFGSLRDENLVTQQLVKGRQDLAAAQEIYNNLRSQDIELSAQEKASILTRVQQNQQLALAADLLEDAKDPAARFREELEAIALAQDKFGRNAPQVAVAVEAAYLRSLEASTRFEDGVSRAFLKMRTEAQNSAAVAEASINAIVGAGTEALTKFAVENSISLKEFARNVVSSLAPVIARLLLVQLLTSALGGGAPPTLPLSPTGAGAPFPLDGARANGGPVGAGKSYLVGEEGPEILRTSRSGEVTPLREIGGARSEPPMINVVNVSDPNEIPQAISNGNADQAIMNVLSRNRDSISKLLGL